MPPAGTLIIRPWHEREVAPGFRAPRVTSGSGAKNYRHTGAIQTRHSHTPSICYCLAALPTAKLLTLIGKCVLRRPCPVPFSEIPHRGPITTLPGADRGRELGSTTRRVGPPQSRLHDREGAHDRLDTRHALVDNSAGGVTTIDRASLCLIAGIRDEVLSPNTSKGSRSGLFRKPGEVHKSSIHTLLIPGVVASAGEVQPDDRLLALLDRRGNRVVGQPRPGTLDPASPGRDTGRRSKNTTINKESYSRKACELYGHLRRQGTVARCALTAKNSSLDQ
ncbi:hypothetical protein J2808_000205 [Pseudarthrobacter sulfonivorans]|nr:hypothetical protein [Pseudarthrobacter sulfonivorans]